MAFLVAFIMLIESMFSVFFVAVVMVAIHDYFWLCPGAKEAMMSIQWWQPLIYFGVLLLCWFLAGRTTTMHVINGSGTKLFGRTATANGYISTKWISMFFFPVLPVDSYEVLAEEEMPGMGARYVMNRLGDFDWPQVISTAGRSLLVFLVIMISFVVFFNFMPCANPNL